MSVECQTTASRDDECGYCLRAVGRLCSLHARDVLPQLASNVGWLRLMGEARVEQTKRQHLNRPDPVAQAALAKASRRNARKAARSPRRGLYGLIRAIANTPPSPPLVDPI